jgi:hypothetical protein
MLELFAPRGASPLDYLHRQTSAGQVEGVGVAAKVVLALLAAGLNPSDFAGKDLVGQLEAAYDSESGSYGSSLFDQALVVLALANAGRAVPAAAVDYLVSYQTTDGAWSFTGDTAALSGDTDCAGRSGYGGGRAQDEAGRGLAICSVCWPYQNPPLWHRDRRQLDGPVLQTIYAVGQEPGDWYIGAITGDAFGSPECQRQLQYQASAPDDNALATLQAIQPRQVSPWQQCSVPPPAQYRVRRCAADHLPVAGGDAVSAAAALWWPGRCNRAGYWLGRRMR